MSDDECGEIMNNGEPCGYTAKYDDGKCGIHSDQTDTSGGGRPTKFTDDRVQSILSAAEQGMTKEGCARAGGVAYFTLRRWLDDKEEFCESFARARAKGEASLVADVKERDPKFILERSFDYIKTEKREIDADVDMDHSADEEQIADLRGSIREALNGGN